EVDRSVHVGFERAHRIAVAPTDQRLRGKMKYEFRIRRADGRSKGASITSIDLMMLDPIPNLQGDKCRWALRCGQRDTGHPGTESVEQQRKTCTLEAGVAGQENAPVAPKILVDISHHPTFQGAASVDHNFSSAFCPMLKSAIPEGRWRALENRVVQ